MRFLEVPHGLVLHDLVHEAVHCDRRQSRPCRPPVARWMSPEPFHGTLFGEAQVRQKYINCEGWRRGGREKWSLNLKQLFVPVTVTVTATVTVPPPFGKTKAAMRNLW